MFQLDPEGLEYHPRYYVGHIGDIGVWKKNSSERKQGTDIVRRSKRTGIRTIPELTDNSLIDITNVGNSP